jgi:hypothetical protein
MTVIQNLLVVSYASALVLRRARPTKYTAASNAIAAAPAAQRKDREIGVPSG